MLWLHLLGAFVWIGGLGFQVLVLWPFVARPETTVERLRLSLGLEARFRHIMWPAVGLVLFTGLANLLNAWYATVMLGGSLPATFMWVLGTKLALILGIVLLQAVQQFVIQPRRLAALADLSVTIQTLSPRCRQLQRLALRLSLAALVLASAVLWCAVLLRHG
jgi:uncharacterized membrane protein